MPMEEDEGIVYVPSQPHVENNINQPFNMEINDPNISGLGVGAWQELWHDDSLVSTPSPMPQGVAVGRNGKGKRLLENFSSNSNKS